MSNNLNRIDWISFWITDSDNLTVIPSLVPLSILNSNDSNDLLIPLIKKKNHE